MKSLLETDTLTLTADGEVGELTLTRPELLNRIDEEMHEDLIGILTQLAVDKYGLRVLTILSTGRAFSAGGDVAWMRRNYEDQASREESIRAGRQVMTLFLESPIPIVMGVQGAAMGLAANLIGAADAVVASRGASLADPHVRIGLVAGDGGCFVWPAALGMLRARRYLLTGDALSAEDAYTFGLVTDLVDEPDEVAPAARELAERIASLPPLAVQGTKQALNHGLGRRSAEVLELGLALEDGTLRSEDLLEAIAAFGERREGVFKGR